MCVLLCCVGNTVVSTVRGILWSGETEEPLLTDFSTWVPLYIFSSVVNLCSSATCACSLAPVLLSKHFISLFLAMFMLFFIVKQLLRNDLSCMKYSYVLLLTETLWGKLIKDLLYWSSLLLRFLLWVKSKSLSFLASHPHSLSLFCIFSQTSSRSKSLMPWFSFWYNSPTLVFSLGDNLLIANPAERIPIRSSGK